jgi:hypothetical protein
MAGAITLSSITGVNPRGASSTGIVGDCFAQDCIGMASLSNDRQLTLVAFLPKMGRPWTTIYFLCILQYDRLKEQGSLYLTRAVWREVCTCGGSPGFFFSRTIRRAVIIVVVVAVLLPSTLLHSLHLRYLDSTRHVPSRPVTSPP